jgi:signal transduction histidine kinase
MNWKTTPPPLAWARCWPFCWWLARHELRTPLNGIIGFSEVLSDKKPGLLNPTQKDYLAEVLNSARHLLERINDVLDLATVEAGKVELHAEPIALGPTLEAVCAQVRPLALQKGIALELNVAPELGEVTLDPQKLKQVCYNLLSNAVKFTDARRFELQVKDSGLGVKPEGLPRLFEPFEQLGRSASGHPERMGLGLALTKKLVELQGGRIEVESAHGQGSTFSVLLPSKCI